MSDFVPRSYLNLRDWLQLQLDGIDAKAAALGMTPQEVAAFKALLNTLLPPVSTIVDLTAQLEQKTADFAALLDDSLPGIRATVKRAKTAPGCTPGIIAEMQWAGDSSEFNPDTARPVIDAEAQRGRVKITGRKPGFEAYNLYSRKKGEVQWKLVAVRKRKFPFYDETPLAVAGTPEVREYMAIGVIADEETAQPSEIKESSSRDRALWPASVRPGPGSQTPATTDCRTPAVALGKFQPEGRVSKTKPIRKP